MNLNILFFLNSLWIEHPEVLTISFELIFNHRTIMDAAPSFKPAICVPEPRASEATYF